MSNQVHSPNKFRPKKCLFSADRMVRTNDNHMQKFATEKRFGLGHFDEVCHCIQNTNYALKISN